MLYLDKSGHFVVRIRLCPLLLRLMLGVGCRGCCEGDVLLGELLGVSVLEVLRHLHLVGVLGERVLLVV